MTLSFSILNINYNFVIISPRTHVDGSHSVHRLRTFRMSHLCIAGKRRVSPQALGGAAAATAATRKGTQKSVIGSGRGSQGGGGGAWKKGRVDYITHVRFTCTVLCLFIKRLRREMSEIDVILGKICSVLFYKDSELSLAWLSVFQKGHRLRDYDLKKQTCLKTANGGRIHYFQGVLEKTSVIAFCPIENWRNWPESSLDWELVPYKYNKAITVVKGVQTVLLETKTCSGASSLSEELQTYLDKDKSQKKIFFGMSFGGAMATMQSLRVAPTELVTIGALRCGDEVFVEAVKKRVRSIRCYANSGDPVPKQPSTCASFPLIDTGKCKSHIVHGIACHGFYLDQDFTTLDTFLHLQEFFGLLVKCLKLPA